MSHLIDFFDVKVIEGDCNWGNVFLTENWTFYIDKNCDQHDLAMKRLGIDSQSIIVSGYYHKTHLSGDEWVVQFRSGRRDIVADNNYFLLLKSVEISCF